MPGRLSGKVCVITGGSVGRAAAVAFAREGGSAVGCDVNVDAAQTTVDLGRIDVLFDNAAMAHFNRLEDITDEEWDLDRRDELYAQD